MVVVKEQREKKSQIYVFITSAKEIIYFLLVRKTASITFKNKRQRIYVAVSDKMIPWRLVIV